MTFNELVKTALSNDCIGITDEILHGKVFVSNAAFRWIDNAEYKDREIDRFTLAPRNTFPEYNKNDKGIGIVVAFK